MAQAEGVHIELLIADPPESNRLTDPLRQIYLVDDDPAVLKALSRLLGSAGYEPIAFSSAKDFMERFHPDAPGCLVLDVSMPGVTGLELQQWLIQSNSPLPVIFLTGHGDIPGTVQAMKQGAVDFLVKPVNDVDLLKSIREASRRGRRARAAREEASAIQARLETLTPRERQVLEHVVAGQLNKQIASDLGTVEKTIKVHRARVMHKVGAQSLAELVRLADRAGIRPQPPSRPSPPAGDAPPI
jgi:FixJ family two-component response regulator